MEDVKNKKLGLRLEILHYLQSCAKPVIKGDIEDFSKALGYNAETGCRRTRDLVKMKLSKQWEDEKGNSWYEYLTPEPYQGKLL